MSQYNALQGMPLAMAYVPWQSWQNVSDGSRGLSQGTIFEELIFPFEYAGKGCRNTRSYQPDCHPALQSGCQMNPCRGRRDCSCQELTKKSF